MGRGGDPDSSVKARPSPGAHALFGYSRGLLYIFQDGLIPLPMVPVWLLNLQNYSTVYVNCVSTFSV